MQKYAFRRYTPKYRAFFILEKRKILKALISRAKIEHVGSTAIPGLGGKGILDILVGIKKSEMVKARKKLVEAGYEFRKKASHPGRFFFRKDYPYTNGKRRVHIHLVELKGRSWKEMIAFRHYLLEHQKDAKRYSEIKKEAVKESLGDGKKYRRYKERFILNILRKALK